MVDPCVTVTSGQTYHFTPGWYQVTETPVENYELDYTSGQCGLNGKVNIGRGDLDTCGMTNTFVGALCEDGIDNDGDGKIDYPADPGCSEANDNNETDSVIPPPLSCEEKTSTMTVVSDTTNTTAPEVPAVAAWAHPAWTASTLMPEATWIWNAEVASAISNEAVTFTKTFEVSGTPTSGSIIVGADNTYEASLNGTEFGSSTNEYNYNAAGADTYNVSSLLQSGTNTLTITVHNIGVGSESNPAGLLYKLTVNKNACEPTPTPVCNPEVNLLENAGFEAPAIDGWDIVPFTNSALKWLGAFVNPEASGRLGLELQASVAGAPFAGLQHAELDGDTPTKIWQNVTLMPSYDYELSTMYSPRPGRDAADNTFEFRLNDAALGDPVARDGSANAGTVWTKEVRTFLAEAASADVGFAEVGTDTSYGAYLDDASLRCVGKHVQTATVVATKVVCDNESDLPDWSGTQHMINATTAQDYVDQSEGSCRIDPEWQFQWAPTSASNPGDNTGEAQGWTTFVSSAVIELADMTSVWVREVWNGDYVPFTGTADTDKVSAEMYCNGDVLHYDNLDYARGLSDGGTVYCVAFNAPVENEDETTPEDNPEACTDGVDNDGDEAIDGRDSDCQPRLTVIKHVVNDNGGQKEASEFDLHVNVDVCSNIEGLQTIVPEGMYANSFGLCLPIPDDQYLFGEEFTQNALNSILDLFAPKTAFAGIEKLFAPASFSGNEEGVDVYFEGITNFVVTEDADTGYVTTMSEDCSGFILLGEHKTCTVTNDDVAPVPQGNGGGGSSSYDYWGCTNQAASNFNALANRDDGSCQLPPAPQGAAAPSEPQGEVLGAATVEPELPASCTEYLRDYLKMGKKNDAEQVKLLQTFLNETMNANLPVTGFFGNLTKNWVKKFQKQYHNEIIQPWEDAGYKGTDITEGTGYVYKTTKRHINIMKCSSLDIPLPDLTPDLR